MANFAARIQPSGKIKLCRLKKHRYGFGFDWVFWDFYPTIEAARAAIEASKYKLDDLRIIDEGRR